MIDKVLLDIVANDAVKTICIYDRSKLDSLVNPMSGKMDFDYFREKYPFLIAKEISSKCGKVLSSEEVDYVLKEFEIRTGKYLKEIL